MFAWVRTVFLLVVMTNEIRGVTEVLLCCNGLFTSCDIDWKRCSAVSNIAILGADSFSELAGFEMYHGVTELFSRYRILLQCVV